MNTNVLVIFALALAALALVLLAIVIVLAWQILRQPRPGPALTHNSSSPLASPTTLPAIPEEPSVNALARPPANRLPPGPLLLRSTTARCPRCNARLATQSPLLLPDRCKGCGTAIARPPVLDSELDV